MYIPEWQQPGKLAALWPQRPDVWREHGMPAQAALRQLLVAAEPYVPILVGAPESQLAAVRKQLPSHFEVIALPYNDAWLCDFAPFWLSQGAVHWRLDAWGGLYSDVAADNRCAQALADYHGVTSRAQNLVFEGGNLTVDGNGHALAVASAVRRSGFDLDYATRCLQTQLNLHQITWVDRGMHCDETRAHIDNMALFIDAHTLVVSAIPAPQHPDFQLLSDFHRQLEAMVDRHGNPYRLISVPTPAPLTITAESQQSIQVVPGVKNRRQAERVLASYVNLVILGGNSGGNSGGHSGGKPGGKALLVPQFQLPEDQVALQILREALPDWDIIGVDAREFVVAGGGLHCMTHVIPADVLASAPPESI